jgi:hypothetical protein
VRSLLRNTPRPQPGDLVAVRSANQFINAYSASADFSFANVAFTANNGELGVVLNTFSDERNSILYHYVRVLFQSGKVGIVHGGLVKIVNEMFEKSDLESVNDGLDVVSWLT